MTVDSFERSGLDDRTFVMVRIAALAATGANPASWLFNLEAAADSGVSIEDVQSVLVAVMPIIGTPRTVAAIGNAMRGIGMAVAGIGDGRRRSLTGIGFITRKHAEIRSCHRS